MFIYLVAIVVIICSIFGLTYSQTPLQVIRDGNGRLSMIQLPTFLNRSSLMETGRASVDGNNGIAVESSQQSMEISSESMEGANRTKGTDEDRSKEDPYELEKKMFDQKFRDPKQVGVTESLWPMAPHRDTDKVMKDIINQKYASDSAKSAPQKVNTNTIFNMIQYESFKEAMAVLQRQQEQEEAAEANAKNERSEEATEK